MSFYVDMALVLFGSFAVCLLLEPMVIPMLRKLKLGQTEREEGLESHKKKSGTPAMGGIMFLISIALVVSGFAFRYPDSIPVLILTVGYGLIGFVDDFIKMKMKRNLGLRAWQKIGLQLLITTLFVLYLINISHTSMDLLVPFTNIRLNIGFFALPLLYLVALGTVNATNLTDGVDGLASSVTSVVALFFGIVCMFKYGGLAPMPIAMFGALLAFLIANAYPAKVFMGDTGSLALGGFVVGMAYMLQMPLFIPIVGLIYLLEAVSVILQVGYFKLTHGKRIFKMAPIHHHFEASGWSETRVVTVFTIVTILMAVVALLGVM